MRIHRLARIGTAGLVLSLTIALGPGIAPTNAVPTSSPTASAPVEVASVVATFDSADARDIKSYVKWILQDIKALDSRFPDAFGMSSRLPLLADNFGRLLDAAVPPQTKAASYKARLATLENFARQAADEYDAGDDTSASARYVVLRKNTGILLTIINKALHTKYALPAGGPTAGATTPTAATPAALSAYDVEDLNLYAGRVVRDITSLDERLTRNGAMTMLLSMLAGHYTNLLDTAVPTGADPADYKSRCQTLANFANMAADEFANGDDLAGSAHYSVIRQETIPVLDAINKALGTTYALP
jgi:hypothetical protein